MLGNKLQPKEIMGQQRRILMSGWWEISYRHIKEMKLTVVIGRLRTVEING